MTRWPDTVIDAVARRRAIIVLGAGSSYQAVPQEGYEYPPTWERFLYSASERLGSNPKKEAKRLIKAGEYLSSCEIIKTHLADDWPACVQDAFGNQRLDGGKLHRVVYEMDLPIVMTTNFDRVYQSAASAHSAGTVRVKSYRDEDLALLARGDVKSRVVLKVHGSIDDVGSMIFTRSDYTRLRNDFPLFQKVLSSLSIVNTLIFVGCGLRDPDLVLMLEDLAFLSRGFGGHYCLIDSKQSAELVKVYNECFGLRCIRYQYDANHTKLAPALEILCDAAIKRRSGLAEASLW